MVPGVPLVAQRARADCGVAALAMVLRFWQPGTNDQTVRSWVGSVDVDKGLKAGRMRDIARGKGLEAFLIEGSFDDLLREIGRQRPVIVGVLQISGRRGYPHYEVVVGVNQGRRKVLTADPAEGWREQDFADFEARWRPARRLALVVFPGVGRHQPARLRPVHGGFVARVRSRRLSVNVERWKARSSSIRASAVRRVRGMEDTAAACSAPV